MNLFLRLIFLTGVALIVGPLVMFLLNYPVAIIGVLIGFAIFEGAYYADHGETYFKWFSASEARQASAEGPARRD